MGGRKYLVCKNPVPLIPRGLLPEEWVAELVTVA